MTVDRIRERGAVFLLRKHQEIQRRRADTAVLRRVGRIARVRPRRAFAADDLPEKIRAYRPDRFVLSADQTEEVMTIDELERRYIMRVIKLVDGNKSRASQLLGLDRRTLYRKLDRYRASEQRQQAKERPGMFEGRPS